MREELRKIAEEKAARQDARPHAVIIHGNPRWVRGRDKARADAFYAELERILSKKYNVSHDPGKPYTVPKKAALWVGHSRGADRLRFAEKGTKTLAIGSPMVGSVNHPMDNPAANKRPVAAHYQVSTDMREKLTKLASKIAAKL